MSAKHFRVQELNDIGTTVTVSFFARNLELKWVSKVKHTTPPRTGKMETAPQDAVLSSCFKT